MAFPNFSQSLATFSNALANREQRRELKRREEEAAAARRAASNARNNRGLVSTLGGIAGATAANYFLPGSGAVGMGLGYQLGSTLAGGANSIVKPYNSQELTGMPYTQPGAFETINQVAPMAMNAYGTYQQQELTRQQNDYTTNLNNLLKIAELQDLAPAATTKMINQLNESHASKYKLEGEKPTYMLDFSVLGSPEDAGSPYNYRSGLKQQENNLNSLVSTGDVQAVEAAYGALPDVVKRTLSKNLDQYKREAAAARVALEDKNLERQFRIEDQDRQNLGEFNKLLDEVKTREQFATFKEKFLPQMQESKQYNQLSPGSQEFLNARIALKTYQLDTTEKLESAKKLMDEAKGLASSGSLTEEDFMQLANNAGLDEANATNLWLITQAKGQADRDQLFISKVAQIDKDNTDLFGNSVAKTPAVLRGLLDSYIQLYEPSPDQVDKARASIETAIQALPQNPLSRINAEVDVDDKKITLQQAGPELPSGNSADGTGEIAYTMDQNLNGVQFAGQQNNGTTRPPAQRLGIRPLNEQENPQANSQAGQAQAKPGGQQNTENMTLTGAGPYRVDNFPFGYGELPANFQGTPGYVNPDEIVIEQIRREAGRDSESNLGNSSDNRRGVTEANLAAINKAHQGKTNRGSLPTSQGNGAITNVRGNGNYTEGVRKLLDELQPVIDEINRKLEAAGGR
jgi:hypothetical protein